MSREEYREGTSVLKLNGSGVRVLWMRHVSRIM